MVMKVLVTGAGGQLGADVMAALQRNNMICLGLTSLDCDLRDFDKTRQLITSFAPDSVIHCAAYTNVDLAEIEEETCKLVNVDVTANIADICRDIDASLVFISTDYVFSGMEKEPYEIDSEPGPLSVYGRTKWLGEQEVQRRLEKHFIVRTSWSFGQNGKNFVKTMLELAKTRDEVKVVADQIGSPTFTVDLAVLLCQMVQTSKYGVYHATNEGFCSWAEFAESIYDLRGLPTEVTPIASAEFPSRAVRPSNSTLSKRSLDAAGFPRLPHWRDALTRYLDQLRTE